MKFFNHKKLIINLFIVLFQIIVFETKAQSLKFTQNFPSFNINKTNGISNAAITSSVIDPNGNIWLGTWDGLNKFTEKRLTTFTFNHDNPYSIPNNIIVRILPPQPGDKHLWLLTKRGVSCINTANGEAKNYLQQLPIPAFDETKMKFFRAGKDIWLSIASWGIGRYNPKRDLFELILPKQKLGQYDLSDQYTFMVRKNLLYLFDQEKQKLTILSLGQHVEKIDDVFLHGQSSYEKLLNFNNSTILIRQLKNHQLQIYNCETNQNQIISGIGNTSTINRSQNGFWIGSDQGELKQCLLTTGEWKVRNMTKCLDQIRHIKAKIWEVREVNRNILLVSTDGDGLYIVNNSPYAFNYLDHQQALNHSTRAILVDGKNLFLGTNNDGIKVFKEDTPMKSIATGDEKTLKMLKDQHQNLWVGTDSPGMLMYAPNGRKYRFPEDFSFSKEDEGLLQKIGHVYAITEDFRGDLWLGTSGKGVFHLKISQKGHQFTVDKVEQIAQAQGLTNTVVYSIIEEKPNIYWIATRGNGIFRYNALKHQMTNNYIGANNYLDVIQIKLNPLTGQLLLATTNGLYIIRFNGLEFFEDQIYNKSNGLDNNNIHAVTLDDDQQAWVTTNTGISVIDLESHAIQNYTHEDGIYNVEFNDGAIAYNRTFGVLAAGSKGIEQFFPSEIQKKKNPKFHLQVLNLSTQDTTYHLQPNTPAIELPFEERSFSVNFQVPIFNMLYHDFRFEYTLKGLENSYTSTSTNTIRYTNLPAGKYDLVIKAYRQSSPQSSVSTHLKIDVQPPWYSTPLAKVIYGLLVLFSSISGIYLFASLERKKGEERLKLSEDAAQQKSIDEMVNMYRSIIDEVKEPVSLLLPAATILHDKNHIPANQRIINSILENTKLLKNIYLELEERRELKRETLVVHQHWTDFSTVLNEVICSFTHLPHLFFNLQLSASAVGYTNEKLLRRITFKIISEVIKHQQQVMNIAIQLEMVEDMVKIGFEVGIATLNSEIKKHLRPQGHTYDLINNLASRNRGKANIDFTDSHLKICLEFATEKDINGEEQAFSEKFDPEEFNVIQPFIGIQNDFKGSGDKKVLLITPSNDILLLVKEIIGLDCSLYRRVIPEEVLEFFTHKTVDLIIFDTNHNDKIIHRTIKKIKNHHKTNAIPIIQLSDKKEDEIRMAALEIGVDSFIPKPFHPKHLKIRVASLLKNKAAQQTSSQKEKIPLPASGEFPLFEYPNKHFDDATLTLDTWAEQMNISKSHLHKLVKEQANCTPLQYITEKRMQLATQLLEEKLPINEVFEKVGYGNRLQFFRAFKKTFGISPAEYKKKPAKTS
ncbi:helix-turn-helix domain-containing protein [Persicobacter psychrovividus]|uniref:Hybrid sensor histidine kinase/response regulator n=1 Tax=Persicobacter psychrovividus TaxID=387638 RepID=A0ABN6LK36_9BACT|nr:hybrid sensor histidine kinase/response regulator [Persicobacter psychrovividus]